MSPQDKEQGVGQAYSLLVHGRVSDFMSAPPFTLTKEAKMKDAKILMRDHRISGIPIIDDEGLLIGLVSIEDIIVAIESDTIDDRIEEHMKTKIVFLYEDMDISIVMEYLKSYSFGRYPVVNRKKRVVGVVTKGDLMMYLYARLGSIYMHNKRRDDVLDPAAYPIGPDTIADEHSFSYTIDTLDIPQAGTGSIMFKKFLKDMDLPKEAVRRASIAAYEAEVNVVIHGGGKGYIKAYLSDDHIIIIIADSGPGIDDIELAMTPGFTTATDEVREHGFGAGMGLDNIQKYSDKLAIISSGTGTKIEIMIILKEGTGSEKDK